MKTFSDSISDSIIITDIPNFYVFYKKFGGYILNSVKPGSDGHKKFTRLYTEEEANAK
jgi:hypothetical protein